MAQVALTDASQVNVGLDSGFNFSITLTGGDSSTFNFITLEPGQTGRIKITHTSGEFGSFQVNGGAGTVYGSPTLTDSAGAVDILYYDCIDSDEILLSIQAGVV